MPATAPERVTGGLGRSLSPGEDGARAERPSPFSLAGFVIMLVAMTVEAIVMVVLLKPKPIALATQVKTGTVAPKLTTVELLAPTIEMPSVVASVPVEEGGAELMTAIVSVTIEIGKVEGRSDEELDIDHLRKVYVPKVEARMHEFRHMLIKALNSSSYAELRIPDVQDKILDDLKGKMNFTLGEYGVEARIRQLYWNTFHFD